MSNLAKQPKLSILLFFVVLLTCGWSAQLVFYPPTHWLPVDPNKLEKEVLVQYVSHGSNKIVPSINLAKENIPNSAEEYLQAVCAMYDKDAHITYHSLGTIKTRSGKAHLLELNLQANKKELTLLQAILIKDKTAYVLTGAAAVQDFTRYRPLYITSIRSMQITDDLISITDPAKQDRLISKIHLLTDELKKCKAENKTKPLQQQLEAFYEYLSEEFLEMGDYWRYLLIQELLKAA